jgi:uncharacterized membrane protein YdjX (TVP38/TMEM64 family)
MKKYIPLVFISFFAFALAILGGKYLSLNDFIQYKQVILDFTARNYVLSLAAFFTLYTLAVAFSFPGALFLTLIGGFLFGTLIGGVTIILAATLGATLLFLTARYFSARFLPKLEGKLDAFQQGFSENAFNYLLFLRLTPLFPFWLVNLAPAFLKVTTKTYMLATLIGIAPGTFIFASLGAGAGDIIGLEGIKIPPSLLLSLGALGLLSLLPLIIRKLRA